MKALIFMWGKCPDYNIMTSLKSITGTTTRLNFIKITVFILMNKIKVNFGNYSENYNIKKKYHK